MQDNNKKIIFSGMQPSGMPTLGNYLGAFTNWLKMQDDYNCIYFIADLHAITIKQDPAQLRKNIKELYAVYLAIGLDPEKSIIYCQSHISAHAELSWILNCYSYMGELSRMAQFKDKSQKQGVNITTGLFNYPVLQVADILLYQADLVPIGEDQRQHLELTRDIATRFNNIYGEVFKVPEVYIPKVGAKIMGLQNPTKKMSKSESDNQNNVIYLLEDLKAISNKVKRSVTDSDNQIIYHEDKAGINNLLSIYSAISGKTIEDSQGIFKGVGYGAFKEAVAEAVVEEIRPIQDNYNRIIKDKAYLEETMKQGADKAGYIANKTMRKVKKKVGFI